MLIVIKTSRGRTTYVGLYTTSVSFFLLFKQYFISKKWIGQQANKPIISPLLCSYVLIEMVRVLSICFSCIVWICFGLLAATLFHIIHILANKYKSVDRIALSLNHWIECEDFFSYAHLQQAAEACRPATEQRVVFNKRFPVGVFLFLKSL